LYQCIDGEPLDCTDDGLYCNGTETCSDVEQTCVHSGNPCPPDTQCDEETDICVSDTPPDDDSDPWHHGDDDTDAGGINFSADDTEEDNTEASGFPEGKVTGGCCGG
jgi:hypothetical protein